MRANQERGLANKAVKEMDVLGPDLTELGLAAGRASRQMESDNLREGRTTHTAPGSLREGTDVLAMNASQGHLIQTQGRGAA